MDAKPREIKEVLIMLVPRKDQERSLDDLRPIIDEIAMSKVGEQYVRQNRTVMVGLVFTDLDWLITGDPNEVEKFQPAHDCAKCLSGNDQARAYLREHPDRKLALCNITYTEIWPD